MNAPAQHALPHWLAGREAIQRQILARIRQNLGALAVAPHLTHLPVQAGWSAVLQIPQNLASDDVVERLVHEAGAIAHPGCFYSMPGNHRLVVSLIVPAKVFAEGIEHLSRWCESRKLTAAPPG